MKSVKNHGAAGLVTILVLLGVGQGCSSKTTDYGLGNTQGDQFSNSDRSAKINDLKSDYNADIDIVDTSYANEHNVDRVLTYLAANESTLKNQLQNVVEIDIGSPGDGFTAAIGSSADSAVQWNMRGTDANSNNITYKIAINCMSSQADLNAGFTMFANDYQGSAILNSAGAQVGVKIVDMVGLSTGNASSFAQNLITAAAGLDFTTATAKEYAGVIQIDSIYAVGPQGTVLVPSNPSSDDLQSFLSSVLNMAKHLDQDFQTLNTALGRTVTYQPDTLMPAEISQGIVTLTAAQSTIVNPKYQALPIMIGRRTETDVSVVRQQNVLLIAFNASPADITNAMSLLKTNNTTPITQAIAGASTDYIAAGVTFSAQPSDFGVSDPTSDGSLLVVQNAIKALEQAAPPLTLQGDGITAITPTSNPGATVVNGTLQVNLSAVDANAISEALSQWQESSAAATLTQNRQTEQSSYVSALQGKYPNISFQIAAYDLSSADKTQEMADGAQAFEQVVQDGAILTQVGITNVVLTKAAATAGEAALVSADRATLTVDLYMLTSKVLSQVLKAAIPAPAPAPSPVPAPPVQ